MAAIGTGNELLVVELVHIGEKEVFVDRRVENIAVPPVLVVVALAAVLVGHFVGWVDTVEATAAAAAAAAAADVAFVDVVAVLVVDTADSNTSVVQARAVLDNTQEHTVAYNTVLFVVANAAVGCDS